MQELVLITKFWIPVSQNVIAGIFLSILIPGAWKLYMSKKQQIFLRKIIIRERDVIFETKNYDIDENMKKLYDKKKILIEVSFRNFIARIDNIVVHQFRYVGSTKKLNVLNILSEVDKNHPHIKGMNFEEINRHYMIFYKDFFVNIGADAKWLKIQPI